MIFSIGEELCSGLRNSKPVWPSLTLWPSTFSRLSTTLYISLPNWPPMLTWSSWLLLDGIVSILEGVHNCLFSLTIPAAVLRYHEAGMKARILTRNKGNPRWPPMSWCPPSEILASSLKCDGQKVGGQCQQLTMKIPPLSIRSSFGEYIRVIGNGVYLADENRSYVCDAVHTRPCTCGMQRNEYGS